MPCLSLIFLNNDNLKWGMKCYIFCVFSLVHSVSMSVFLECLWSESIYECTRLNLWPLYCAIFTVSSAYHVTILKTYLLFKSCIGLYPAFIRFTSYTFDGKYFIKPSDCPRFLFILPWLQFQPWIFIVVCLDNSHICQALSRLVLMPLLGLSCCFHWTVPLFRSSYEIKIWI